MAWRWPGVGVGGRRECSREKASFGAGINTEPLNTMHLQQLSHAPLADLTRASRTLPARVPQISRAPPVDPLRISCKHTNNFPVHILQSSRVPTHAPCFLHAERRGWEAIASTNASGGARPNTAQAPTTSLLSEQRPAWLKGASSPRGVKCLQEAAVLASAPAIRTG